MPPEKTTGTQTIVLIDDDREISSTLSKVLEASGYRVHVANNGLEGRKLVENEQPDLVITDMMMPQMGGFPVLEFLKELDNPPKVIMMTANEGERHKSYAEMLGVTDYLRKPFAMDIMLNAVQQALSQAEEESTKKKKAEPKKSKRNDS